MTKEEFFGKPSSERFPIAYISALGGLEIHQIEYGIEDYAFCAEGAWTGKKNISHYQHKLKIRYSKTKGAYIEIRKQRFYFRDAVKTQF